MTKVDILTMVDPVLAAGPFSATWESLKAGRPLGRGFGFGECLIVNHTG